MNGVAGSENLGENATRADSNQYSLRGALLVGGAFKSPGVESSLRLF